MKKNKTLLAVLLGCVLAVTAVAGGIAWGNRQNGQEDETDNYISLEEPTGEYLWNTPTEEADEGTAEDPTTDTEEEATEEDRTQSVLEVPQVTEPEVPETPAASETPEPPAPSGEASVPVGMEQALALNFGADSALGWPVQGEVIKEFNMDETVYFPTLKQYKTSPSILVGSEAGTTVSAAADGLVTAVGTDEEIGHFVTMNLGNGYAITYGQLQDVSVGPNQYVSKGESLGILSTPTIYYVVEGDNLYFKMTKDGVPIDPLDYLQ